ncbi:MAG: hypothetical protein JNJ59_03610 [Deltaproteobacteria bacterium]|nr:hypothetical protein [Deltaproteobacteria bacterium]
MNEPNDSKPSEPKSDASKPSDSAAAPVLATEPPTAQPAPTGQPAEATPAPLLALPAPEPGRAYRVLALTEAGAPLTRAFARTVQALRDSGTEVLPLALPRRADAPSESTPTIGELKRGIASFARDLVRGMRGSGGNEAQPEPWLVSQLRAVEGRIDAVIATDPEVARAAFPLLDTVFPGAVRVGIDGDYHIDPEWKAVDLDAFVVPHPGLGGDLPRLREGRARAFIGGPVVAGAELAAKTLDALPQVAVSFARLEPGDVDSLLFQLSLARPERFSLLFLPSSRQGVDELVRARAVTYGLRGKRPKSDAETEAWIRGSSLLVGLPSPAELATAAAAKVPVHLVTNEARLQDGDRFLLQHGAVLSDVPITIAVLVEGLLPGGPERERAVEALSDLDPSGPSGAAQAIRAAIKAGRPTPATAPPPTAHATIDDGLEDIGGPATTQPGVTTDLPIALRRAYLKEIILQQQVVERNLGRAQAGLETWQRRVRLARASQQDALADRAVPRVEGLMKVIDQLQRELRDLKGLRERFASPAPLSAADRAAASRFLSPGTAASLDRSETAEATESAFAQLEIEDALAVLKRKLAGG